MKSLSKIIALALLASNGISSGSELERVLILKSFNGTPEERKGRETFSAGEVLTAVSFKKDSALICSQYGCGIKMWVPNDLYIRRMDFRKIEHWDGQEEIGFGGGDADSEYKIKPNGSFSGTWSAGTANGKSFGYVYAAKNIIWLKRKKDKNFSSGSLFCKSSKEGESQGEAFGCPFK